MDAIKSFILFGIWIGKYAIATKSVLLQIVIERPILGAKIIKKHEISCVPFCKNLPICTYEQWYDKKSLCVSDCCLSCIK